MKRSPDTDTFERDPATINGLESHVLDMRTHIQLEESQFCSLRTSGDNGNTQEVVFTEFPPGSIIAFRWGWGVGWLFVRFELIQLGCKVRFCTYT